MGWTGRERVGCLKACWEKKEQKNGWEKKKKTGIKGERGENITRTEPGCKCLRTCPLGWTGVAEGDTGERSENAVCTHCQRGFNTPVCGQGVKTRTHIDIRLTLYRQTHALNARTHAKPQNRSSSTTIKISTHNRTYMKRPE